MASRVRAHGQRWDQFQVKTLGLQKVRQRPVVVAGGFKADAYRLLEALQIKHFHSYCDQSNFRYVHLFLQEKVR